MTPPPPPPAGQRPGLVDAAAELDEQWRRWTRRRATSARDHLIVHYSPLVKFVAGRIGAGLPRSVDPADLVGYGVFGLIDAIERYEPGRGAKFETFAAPRIRGAIYDGLRALDWVPRVPFTTVCGHSTGCRVRFAAGRDGSKRRSANSNDATVPNRQMPTSPAILGSARTNSQHG